MGRGSSAQTNVKFDYTKFTSTGKMLTLPTYKDPFIEAVKAHNDEMAKEAAQKAAEAALEAAQQAEQEKQAEEIVNTPKPVLQPNYTPSGCVNWHSDDYYLDKIIDYESGGNSCSINPGGCFGLLQACPGEPLREACGGDPSCQIAWFQANKTGGRSWAEVWQHELTYGWW